VGPVFGHRLILTPDAEFSGVNPSQVLARVIAEVPAPVERGAK
jgi:MoxR-like ATPase